MMKNDFVFLVNEFFLFKNNDFLLEWFFFDMKGSILEKMCKFFVICVEEVMRELIKEFIMVVIDFNEDLVYLIILWILEESYDI